MQMKKQQLHRYITDFFNDKMPFNQHLGIQVSHLENLQAEIRLDWQDCLMGNPVHKILHGGVTAAILDTVGSVAALLYGVEQIDNEEQLEAFCAQLPYGATLDMRVDYLRPGKGEKFVATAQVIRRGKKVAVCRMDLHNDIGLHIATGTATYII